MLFLLASFNNILINILSSQMLKNIKHLLIISLILFAIFNLSYNSTFNGHYHFLNTGRIIFHAHPVSNNSTESPTKPSHSHSKLEFLFYEMIATIVFLIISILIFLNIFTPQKTTSIKKIFITPLFLIIVQLMGHRGPPFQLL